MTFCFLFYFYLFLLLLLLFIAATLSFVRIGKLFLLVSLKFYFEYFFAVCLQRRVFFFSLIYSFIYFLFEKQISSLLFSLVAASYKAIIIWAIYMHSDTVNQVRKKSVESWQRFWISNLWAASFRLFFIYLIFTLISMFLFRCFYYYYYYCITSTTFVFFLLFIPALCFNDMRCTESCLLWALFQLLHFSGYAFKISKNITFILLEPIFCSMSG